MRPKDKALLRLCVCVISFCSHFFKGRGEHRGVSELSRLFVFDGRAMEFVVVGVSLSGNVSSVTAACTRGS